MAATPGRPFASASRIGASSSRARKVGRMLLPSFTNSWSPKTVRSRASAPLSAGCVTCNRRAARVTCPSVMSASKATSRFKSKRSRFTALMLSYLSKRLDRAAAHGYAATVRLHTTWLILAFAGQAVAGPAADEIRESVRAYRLPHEPAIDSAFAELLAIPNHASDSANIRKNAQLIARSLQERKVETRLLELEGAPPVVFGKLRAPGG